MGQGGDPVAILERAGLDTVLSTARRAASGRDWAKAVAAYEAAVALAPGRADVLMESAMALLQTRDVAGAEGRFRAVTRLQPGHCGAWNNLGSTLAQQKRFAEALACFERAAALAPGEPRYRNSLGAALQSLGRFAEAEDAFRKALALAPDAVPTLVHLGNLLLESLGRSREAIACLDRALEIDPRHALAHFNRGMALLLEGRLEEGWAEYEWRTKLKWWRGRIFPGPQWLGEPLGGRRIFLHHEQGLGDFIQCCRFFPVVARLGGEVVVGADPALRPLAQSVPGVARVLRDGEAIPPCEASLPMMSLPRVLGIRLDNIPAPEGYLQADPALEAKWAGRLAHLPGLKVGLCWQGNPGHVQDAYRSLPLARLAPLAALEGVSFVSLQKGPGEEQAEQWPGPLMNLSGDLAAREGAFSELAAIMANLDLVITVDTAPAHLAGALGRPVFLLLPSVPEWRWLQDRDDSPWYGSARLFRQAAAGDWPAVVERVRLALEARSLERLPGSRTRP
jgi:tetratricopeptide (TPR) repeat protein